MLMDDDMKEAVFEQLKAISAKKFLPSSLATEEKLHAPPVEAIQFIYNNITEKGPMRKVLVDLFTTNGDASYAPHILTPSSSTIELPADFTRDLALSLMSARALPKTTEDAATEITALKREVHEVTYERDLAERRIEGHQLRKKRLADDIKELRTRNNDRAELNNMNPDSLFAGLRRRPGEGTPYERSQAGVPGGVRARQQMGSGESLMARAARRGDA
jgi:hypothetical protein